MINLWFYIVIICCTEVILSDFNFINSTETITGIGNKSVELKCHINKNLTYEDYFNVIWMKYPRRLLTRGMLRVTPDTRFRLISQSILDPVNFNLLIEAAKEKDSGEYRCSFNRENYLFNKKIMLMIRVPPTILTPFKPKLFAREGEYFQLICNVSGKPNPKVLWFSLGSQKNEKYGISVHDAMMVYEKKRITEVSSIGPTLVITKIHRNMTGWYMCLATNEVKPDAKSKFFLTVYFKPEVSMTNSEIHQRLGGDTIIECVVHSSPMGTVQWLHNSRVILPLLCGPIENQNQKYCLVINQDEYRYSLNSKSVKLTIFGIKNEDYGDYICKVQTMLGIGYAVTKLKHADYQFSAYKPTFLEEPPSAPLELKQERTSMSLSTPVAVTFAFHKQQSYWFMTSVTSTVIRPSQISLILSWTVGFVVLSDIFLTGY